ncbi:IclR family transcriptional regulator [Arthrobacter wenxiniae]|uniref:IclR family transcriptional regulator n=1 Tax=Arthrobacter wenxiniae TaxID=2713570 RepID=A0A7Y7IFH1_9MICC|nr:IclR family transcriptional regulator [Arthrobacter wenxiniae]NVM93916.1 IclR family transcriptional regulator [Arthrobacter wenxiniae]
MSLSSLNRGLKILTMIADSGRMRVDEVASALDIPPSSAYRYIKLFRETDYLYELDGYYYPGVRVSSRDEQTEKQHLVEVAAPVLNRLCSRSGETVILTVRVQMAALCLERLSPRRADALSFYRGSVRPLHAGASATALLAYAPADVVATVEKGGMRKFTAVTPDASRLKVLLPAIRSNGFSVSEGEVDPFMVAVAAPVFRHGHCICAVSIAGRQQRLSGQRLDDAVELVCNAAAELGHELETAAGSAAWMTEEGW